MACSNANMAGTEYPYDWTNYSYTYDDRMKGGFFCDWGVGVEYKRWSLSMGLQHQKMAHSSTGFDSDGDNWDEKLKAYSNSFYVKVGVNF